MSSMQAPQKLREMQACIATLPPQQRVCHSEEPPSLTRKTQSMDPSRTLQRRSGKSFSQDRVGDLLQFWITGIFLFTSSSAGLEARPLQLGVEECPLVWKRKDLRSYTWKRQSQDWEGWNWGLRKLFRLFVPLCEQQKSPQLQSDCFHFASHLFLFMQVCSIPPLRSKHTVARRMTQITFPPALRQKSLANLCVWVSAIIAWLMMQPICDQPRFWKKTA